MLKRNSLAMVAAIGALFFTTPAMADAIDGSWCNADGKHLRIDGKSIMTPGGVAMTGDYDRHNFSYISPEGEDFPNQMLKMTQRSEELAMMRLPDGSEMKWTRCSLTS